MNMFDYFKTQDELTPKPKVQIVRPDLVAEAARRAAMQPPAAQPDFFAPTEPESVPTERPRLIPPTNVVTEPQQRTGLTPLALPNNSPVDGSGRDVTDSGYGLQYPDRRLTGGDADSAPALSAEEQARQKLYGLENSPVVNSNPGFKGRLVDTLREGVISAGQAYNAGRERGESAKEALAGSVGGAGAGIAAGIADPTMNEKRIRLYDIAKEKGLISDLRANEDAKLSQQLKAAQVDYATKRPDIEQQKIDQKGKEFDERSKANAMRVIASVYNRLPSFDSKDPNNADVVAQMQEIGIPVIDKNPNKDVKVVRDESDGSMFVVSTDKQTGETSAEQVMQNGQPLKVATKSQIGMRVKDLDRASREKIAEARNNTLLKVAGMNAGSRERVANINQQGAGERVDKQIKAADDRQKTQVFNTSFARWQQQFQKTNFRAPSDAEIQQAQENIRKTIYGQ